MANKVNDFGTVKNLREWFDDALSGDKYLYRKVPVDSEHPEGLEQCYNVDLIWDGTNYHIAYEDKDENGTKYVQPFTYTDERVWSIY